MWRITCHVPMIVQAWAAMNAYINTTYHLPVNEIPSTAVAGCPSNRWMSLFRPNIICSKGNDRNERLLIIYYTSCNFPLLLSLAGHLPRGDDWLGFGDVSKGAAGNPCRDAGWDLRWWCIWWCGQQCGGYPVRRCGFRIFCTAVG